MERRSATSWLSAAATLQAVWRWEAEEPTSVRRTHPCFDRPLETIAWAMLSIVCSFRPVLLLSARHLNLFQLLQPRCAAHQCQRHGQCESVSSVAVRGQRAAGEHTCAAQAIVQRADVRHAQK